MRRCGGLPTTWGLPMGRDWRPTATLRTPYRDRYSEQRSTLASTQGRVCCIGMRGLANLVPRWLSALFVVLVLASASINCGATG